MRRYLFGLLLTLFTITIGYNAAKWGWADIQSQVARNLFVKWKNERAKKPPEDWQRARVRAHQAYELNPLNAEYAAALGRLYEWHALQQPQWTQHAHENREKAIRYYTQATTLRPSWGSIWARLAQSKILNQELDDIALSSLEKAMVLSPWEAKAQQNVIWIGLNIWDQLPKDTQTMLITTLRRSLKLQPKKTINRAIKLNRQDLIQPLLNDKEKEIFDTLTLTAKKS